MHLHLIFLQDYDRVGGEETSSSDEESSSEEEEQQPKKKQQRKRKRPKVEIEYEQEIDQPSTSKAKLTSFWM